MARCVTCSKTIRNNLKHKKCFTLYGQCGTCARRDHPELYVQPVSVSRKLMIKKERLQERINRYSNKVKKFQDELQLLLDEEKKTIIDELSHREVVLTQELENIKKAKGECIGT